jgi:hypothetical protein
MPKPPVRSVLLRVRVFPKELVGWKQMARRDAMTLATWVRDRLNMAFDEPESPFLAGPRRTASRRTSS